MTNGRAEFWEGWQAVQTRQPCKYGVDQLELRQAWAEGFASAVAEAKSGKVWWKSNTIRTAIVCLTAGVIVLIYGKYFGGVSNGSEIMSAGGGMSVGAILSMGIRKMLNETPLYGGGGNTWYNGSSQ